MRRALFGAALVLMLSGAARAETIQETQKMIASGVVAGPVFEDNVKAWSGDHIVDPRLVPGIFLANHVIHKDDPAIIDLAPTALTLFGIKPLAHMEGAPIIDGAQFKRP